MWRYYGLILACMLPLAAQAKDCGKGNNVYDVINACEKQIERDKQRIASEANKLKQLVQQHNQKHVHISVDKEWQQSQKLWQRFVEADCALESMPAQVAQGAGYGMVKTSCIAERYRQRITQLRQLQKEVRLLIAEE